MSILSLLWLAAGLSLLLGGSFLAVRGAATLAEALRLSPAVRGLVPIAFAASLPELAVVLWATTAEFDLPDLALGDVVGSVIGNYLLALAVAALALPLIVAPRLLQFAFPLAIVISLGLLAAAWTGEIATGVGACLLLAAIAWPIVGLFVDRRVEAPQKLRKREASKRVSSKPAEAGASNRPRRDLLIAIVSFIVGAIAVYFGARPLVASSSELAVALRLDESTLGLTLLALVTTLPEAIACLVLTVRGDRDTAVGLAIGSSLFSLTAALGLATVRSTEGLEVPAVIFEFALPVAIAAGLACVPSFYGMRRLSRGSGLALFAFYVAFFAYATVGENWYQANDPDDAQQTRFYAMFLIAIGLIVVLSIVAIVERLAQKARLADE